MIDIPTAQFSDGQSALAYPVRVVAETDALRLVDLGGGERALWPYRGMYLAEEVYGDHPVRLMHRDAGSACLTLPDEAALRALQDVAPGLRRLPGGSRRRWSVRGIVWTAVVVVLLAALTMWGMPRLADALLPFVPWSWSRAFGDQVVASLESSAPACESPRDAGGRRALERLVGRLMQSPAAQGKARDPFRVVVLDTSIPNALAAPGGRILVFRGILGLAHSPDELAGVLAHEVGHALSRHPERGLLRVMGWQWLLGGLFGTDAWGVGGVQTLLSLAYTRDDERAADRLGLALLEGDGLRSGGLAGFLERLAADPKFNGRGIPGFLASHPLPEARATELRALANPRITGEPWTVREWAAIRQLCGGPVQKPVSGKRT